MEPKRYTPEHIHTGFSNLSAFLQVAALHAEYLCRSAEVFNQTRQHEPGDNQPACRGVSSDSAFLSEEEIKVGGKNSAAEILGLHRSTLPARMVTLNIQKS